MNFDQNILARIQKRVEQLNRLVALNCQPGDSVPEDISVLLDAYYYLTNYAALEQQLAALKKSFLADKDGVGFLATDINGTQVWVTVKDLYVEELEQQLVEAKAEIARLREIASGLAEERQVQA